MCTNERKNSTEVRDRENRECPCVMLQSIAVCFVACPISQAGISVPANVSISQIDRQTDRRTDRHTYRQTDRQTDSY
jgi:hypothetical protein